MVKNKKGFTLIELLVAISIFAILSLIISGIYLAFSKSQARTKASLTLLNDSQYIMETIVNEVKNNELYLPSPCCNNYDKCIGLIRENGDHGLIWNYNIDGTIGYVEVDYLGNNFDVTLNDKTELKVTYFDLILPENDNKQPMVTIIMEVENVTEDINRKVSYKLQTTVSSRIYK